MRANQTSNVQAAQDITIEYQDGIVGSGFQMVQRMPDRASGPQRLLLSGDDHLDAQIGILNELCEDFSPVTRGEHDALHSGVPCAGDLMNSERHARHRQHRLGGVHGQRSKAGSLTSDEQHGLGHRARVPHRRRGAIRTM